MVVDYHVANVNEAVQLAGEWRAKGTHTWFRGQALQEWPLVSSLGRLIQGDAPAVQKVEARIQHFYSWLNGVPQHQYLLEEQHANAFFAVLQHYGVPTHYVDFTPEPDIAGFFAAHSPKAVPGEQGCIIAIDPDEFVDTLRQIAEVRKWQAEIWPEKIEVSVRDLWRMQAQSGSFVYLAFWNVEVLYGYDRILFPHDGKPHPIPLERIYPTRKSPLEIQLDQFFTEELMRNNQRYISHLFDQWRSEGIQVRWIAAEEPNQAKYLTLGTREHPSWSEIDVRWLTAVGMAVGEDYQSATSGAPEVTLTIPDGELSVIEVATRRQVQDVLASSPEYRAKAIRWVVAGTRPGKDSGTWELLLERVWDGMRRLPYTDEQLAAAIAATAAMSARPGPAAATTTLELASQRWITSRASLDTAKILAAYREDLREVLRDPTLADKPRLMLQALRNPAYVFDFDELVELFATEIIPAQVVRSGAAGSGEQNSAVFFSPAVPIMGIA